MNVIEAGNYYWTADTKTFVRNQEIYIHQCKRYTLNPLEWTCHGIDLFFVSKEKQLDLSVCHDKFVAVISNTCYDSYGKYLNKTRFCKTSYTVLSRSDRKFYELIAALPGKEIELLLELTLDIIVKKFTEDQMAPSSTG